MKYITCLLLSGSILSCLTEVASGVQASVLLPNSDRRKDVLSFPQVPDQQTRSLHQSMSVEETKRRLAQEISIQIANDIAYGLVIAHE
ncbi:hypothetical protein [Crocosphaera sp.]|uniref:hypothetical protein n=1 Tax=Crocosphaera sp. TaxID=2729996 RepID=UPI003F20365B|nr:hypothetical protein [Crocosphaera sp.]